MDFIIKNSGETILNMARKIGYKPLGKTETGEYNLVKDLSNGYRYPRFHAFLKKDEEHDEYSVSLHIDQKQPSYEHGKNHAHSGEYKGEVIEAEAERIKKVLSNTSDTSTREGNIYKF